MVFSIIGWFIGVFSLLAVVLFLFTPLLKNRKDETLRLRMFNLIYTVLIVILSGHTLHFW